MKKRSILQQVSAGGGCKVCRTIRPFLIVAGALMALLWSKPEWSLPSDIDYSTLVGDLFALAFLGYLAWRVYEYRRDQRQAGEHADSDDSAVPVRRVRRRNRVAGDPRGWK
jgi:hypothetical protein